MIEIVHTSDAATSQLPTSGDSEMAKKARKTRIKLDDMSDADKTHEFEVTAAKKMTTIIRSMNALAKLAGSARSKFNAAHVSEITGALESAGKTVENAFAGKKTASGEFSFGKK